MWTPTTRQQHSRPVTRYQTDLTDAEWRVIAPHLPKPCATGRPPWTARSEGPIAIGLVDYESPTTLKALLDWKAHGVVFREPAGMVMGPVERKIDCFGEVSPKHRADTEVARDAANALADSAAKQAPCGRP
jgi:hypothetical protein